MADATGIAKAFGLSKTGSGTAITGSTSRTASQLAAYYDKYSPIEYPTYYKNNDAEAKTLEEFCQIYIDEAKAENINVDVAFCQAMLETGWLQFKGSVNIDKFNFAGIGAVDSNPSAGAARFSSVREGIRAQIQHLKAYANKESLVNACVDPRFNLVTRGSAPNVENLSGKWASDKEYGNKIVQLINKLRTYMPMELSFSKQIKGKIGATYGFLVYSDVRSGNLKLYVEDTDIATVRVANANDSRGYYCEIVGRKAGTTTLIAELGGTKIEQEISVTGPRT